MTLNYIILTYTLRKQKARTPQTTPATLVTAGAPNTPMKLTAMGKSHRYIITSPTGIVHELFYRVGHVVLREECQNNYR